jgi:hypothetical protein
VFSCRRGLRQVGILQEISRKQMIVGPTILPANRALDEIVLFGDMPSLRRSQGGAFLMQAAF